MKRICSILFLLTIVISMPSIFLPAPVAAAYPEKPIIILCWSEPGSAVDLLARAAAQLGEKFVGKPMSVLTKTGGGGTVAMAYLLKQKPDGYTLLAPTLSYATVMAWGRAQNLKNEDFSPICRLHVESPILSINADRPYNTWQKFVEYAKQNPNKLKVANSGSGQMHHTTWLRIKKMVGIQCLDIPYDGGRPAVTSVMGGHDDAVINNPSIMKTAIETGKLKGIFTTGGKRLEAIPDIPTLKELGIDVERYQWRGMMASAEVPKDIIKYLDAAFEKMTKTPEWDQMLKKYGWEHGYMGAEAFTKLIVEEIKDTREILIEAGLLKTQK